MKLRVLLLSVLPLAVAAAPATVRLRAELERTLAELVATLESLQVSAAGSPTDGALACPPCGVWHTRAAEALWPFALLAAETGDERHAQAARAAATWLFRQQQTDGSWKETPEEWTGTTTDQLLMLVLAYEKLSPRLAADERAAWMSSMERAADYLERVMSPEFASINYCATTTASLAAVHRLVAKPAYLAKARRLARETVAKMDEDGFLNGEGGKCHDRKMGVDLGYSLEMSFWGLAYYARLTGDALVDAAVRRALPAHLPFIYPDGLMDGSWGIRSNKWTTYGSGTSDGCQALFMLYADEDPVYATAAWRNLEYLRTCIRDGRVQYGPHHAAVMNQPPCIYPTFAKAKNLALAMHWETKAERPVVDLPTQRTGWMRHFPTIDVAAIRSRAFMATITAYGYKDIAKGPDSKYMFRPTGGALSCLWLEGHGLVQASSQTEYHRWEPMHFPEATGLRPLTPRIEFSSGKNHFSNLHEFDARLTLPPAPAGAFAVSAYGELKDRNWHYGGVSYRLTHVVSDTAVEKEVTLFYRGASPEIRVVEPIVAHAGMRMTQVDARTVKVEGGRRSLWFRLEAGEGRIELGRGAAETWSPYPALRALPIEVVVAAPGPDTMKRTVRVRLATEP